MLNKTLSVYRTVHTLAIDPAHLARKIPPGWNRINHKSLIVLELTDLPEIGGSNGKSGSSIPE